MTLRKWSYFRRSEDLTEPLHTRIYLFSSLLSFIEISSKREYHQRFTSGEEGGGRGGEITTWLNVSLEKSGMREWKKGNIDEWTFTRLGLAVLLLFFFFLSLQEGTAFGDPGRPIQTDSTASGIPRQRETETESERERERANTARFELSLSLWKTVTFI